MWRRMIALADCACRASAKPFSVLSLINAAAELASSPRRGLHPATTLAAFAALTSAAVASIPGEVKDQTCGSLFRHGRASIVPRVNIDLQVGSAERRRLTKFFENFAAAHELSFRKPAGFDQASTRFLYLNFYNERGTTISVTEQYCHDSTYARPRADRGVSIPVYEAREGSDWRELAKDLIAKLETVWPGKVRFRSRDGRIIPKPAALSSDPPTPQFASAAAPPA